MLAVIEKFDKYNRPQGEKRDNKSEEEENGKRSKV
jgi:hypothetical protein